VQPKLNERLAVTATALRPWPDRPVPIALVITDLDVGGAERALVSLATRLDRARWRASVHCLGVPGQLNATLKEHGVPVTCLGANRRRPIQAVASLARSLRRVQPQIIQSFMFHANIASRLAAPLAGSPWVLGGLRVAERQKRWHLIVDRLTAPLACGSVCVSHGVLAFSRVQARIDPARLTVIPNGVDPGLFDSATAVPRAAIGIPEDAHLALCVGRLDPQKGLPDLLAAANRVVATNPRWHLALAGDGPSRDWLTHEIAANNRLRDHVHWLGQRDDVPGLLKSADVLVSSSLWEGMPNAVLEAMAARRPVIGTAVEGTAELVIPGQTGWLVPPGSVESLSEALVAAHDSPDLCRRFGEYGYRRVEQEYSQCKTVAAYEVLWAGVLGLRLPIREVAP
jgi:glycosyltransferase involved in cell wall biosynthesis